MSRIILNPLQFYDGKEIDLLLEWFAKDYDINIVRNDGFYRAYSKETGNLLFASTDPYVIYKALLLLVEESENYGKTKER